MNERHKFWFESLRSILFGCLGFLAMRSIASEDKLADLVQETRLDVRRGVVDDFVKSSHRYAAVTYDIVKGNGTETDKRWGELFDEYVVDSERLHAYFDTLDDDISLAKLAAKKIKEYEVKLSKLHPDWEKESEEIKRAGYCPSLDREDDIPVECISKAIPNLKDPEASCWLVREALGCRQYLKQVNRGIIKNAVASTGISPIIVAKPP